MVKRRVRAQDDDSGGYFWRGGKRIELERDPDRFTMIPADGAQLARASSAPGIRMLTPVTNRVFKASAAPAERDAVMAALRSSTFRMVVHHAYRPRGTEGTLFYLTDCVIATFDASLKYRQIDVLLDRYGVRLLKEYRGDPGTYLLQVTSSSGVNPIKVANRLAAEKGVRMAEPNLVNRFRPAFTPEDPYFSRQWHLQSKDAPQLLAGASVSAPEAWEITRGERGVVVAVVDDGFDLNHPDFTGVKKVVFPKDYVDGDANPFPEKEQGDYHGTPCAGVAIAEMNGKGVVGVAAGCAFMPVRFPLAADDDLLIDIFEEVGKHADVISCSWGPPPVYAPLASAVETMFTRLARTGGPRSRGCVVCFAAGNFDAPVNDPVNAGGFLWLDYGSGVVRKTTGPILNGLAAHPRVLAVAASTSLNRHAAYSNWGGEICVCAPSNNFHPLDPSLYVPGRGIWTTDNEAFGEGFTAHSRYTGKFGGTSSATPLVAGIAALVLSANPGLSAGDAKEILQSTADRIIDREPDTVLGGNRGGYNSKGHSEWFGYGKVNAARAVAEASRKKQGQKQKAVGS
jgi:subtilisin family serine protease